MSARLNWLARWKPGPGEWNRAAALHLFRRAGFGETDEELERSLVRGFEASVEEYLARDATPPELRESIRRLLPLEDIVHLQAWWMAMILDGGAPLRERLTLMWHDHFATSYAKVDDEAELMPLRDEFAELIRSVRRRTGKPLHVASTVTVTRENLSGVASIVSWFVENADAFSMVSFQPVAAVGRTRAELRAPVAVAPQEGTHSAGPKSGCHFGSFRRLANPSYSPCLTSGSFRRKSALAACSYKKTGTPNVSASWRPNVSAMVTHSFMITLATGINGQTSMAPMRGCSPLWCRISMVS